MTAEELRERRAGVSGQPKPIKLERGDYVRIIEEPALRWRILKFGVEGRVALISESGMQVRAMPLDELQYSPLDK